MRKIFLSALLLLCAGLCYSKEYRQKTYKVSYWQIGDVGNLLLKQEFVENEFVINLETKEVTCIIGGEAFKDVVVISTVESLNTTRRCVIWTKTYEMYVYEDSIIIAFNNDDRHFYQFVYK